MINADSREGREVLDEVVDIRADDVGVYVETSRLADSGSLSCFVAVRVEKGHCPDELLFSGCWGAI